jgi:nucleoside-diphosphate-sugar epimerase
MITGGTGFLGSYLACHLVGKIPVRFWSRAFPAAPRKAGLSLMATPHPDMPFFPSIPPTLLPTY